MYPFILKKKATQAGPDPATIISAASIHFDFRERSLTEKVSNTSPLTLSRPYQKYSVNSSGRYSVAAAGSAVYDHSAAGSCYGVLVEGVSKNYIGYSNNFTGANSWDSANTSAGLLGGGEIINLTPATGLPGPVLSLENTVGYTATRYAPTTTNAEHYVGKYGGYGGGLDQFVIAFKINGDTANYAIRVLINGPYFTVNSSGQIVESQLSFTTIPGTAAQSVIYYPKVRTTSDGWVLVSCVFDPTSFAGNNTKIPRIQLVKLAGSSYSTTFAGAGDVTFDLFGFSREYANSRSFYGAERLYSSYIHTGAGATVTRAADSLIYSGISAGLQSVMVQVHGPVYDASLLSLDDNSATPFSPGGVNTYAYEPNNLIDLRGDASAPASGLLRASSYVVYLRRSVAVTINTSTGVFTASAAHNFSAGMAIELRNMANPYDLPAPLNIRQTYYVLPTGLTSTTFSISETANGAAVTITGSATGTYVARIQTAVSAGVPAADGAQRFIVSWDNTNVLCVATGGGVVLTPHNLGAAPTLSTMRFGTGYRTNRLADLNQPIARTIGWGRMLTQAEALALLRQP